MCLVVGAAAVGVGVVDAVVAPQPNYFLFAVILPKESRVASF